MSGLVDPHDVGRVYVIGEASPSELRLSGDGLPCSAENRAQGSVDRLVESRPALVYGELRRWWRVFAVQTKEFVQLGVLLLDVIEVLHGIIQRLEQFFSSDDELGVFLSMERDGHADGQRKEEN